MTCGSASVSSPCRESGNRLAARLGRRFPVEPRWWDHSDDGAREKGKVPVSSNVVTVEILTPSHESSKVPLSGLPEVLRSVPKSSSLGLTLDDGEDDCVIVTVEPEFSTVTALRERTFYNLRIADDPDDVLITTGGEEISWPKGCLLPREMALEVLMEAEDREVMWSRHTWVAQ